MSRARVARRIATAAAYGGGGIGLLGGAAVGLLLAEVRLAKTAVGGSGGVPPVADGRYGGFLGAGEQPANGFPDSGPDGNGARFTAGLARATPRLPGRASHRAGETPGGAAGVRARRGRRAAGRPGATSPCPAPGPTTWTGQVGLLLGPLGGAAGRLRDHDRRERRHAPRSPPQVSVRHLAGAVRRLRDAGRRGGRRHLSGPGHDRAGLPAAALGRAAAQPPARRGADDRRRGAGRAHGVAGRPAGPRVRGRTRARCSAPTATTRPRRVTPPPRWPCCRRVCAALGLWPQDDERPDGVGGRYGDAGRQGGGHGRGGERHGGDGRHRGSGRRTPWALLKYRRQRPVPEVQGTLTAR